jgi:diphosphomevalonate decarboxylase
LSRLARLGSGSACRSIPGGFAIWEGESDETSYARQLAPPDHWDLQDVIALVSRQHKATTSYDGHDLAASSPLHAARLAALPGALAAVKSGIEHRDLHGMGPAIERDALAMHGVMMTSQPMLLYWEPATVVVLRAIQSWRKRGLGVYFTMDAGPNVHCLCEAADAADVEARLRDCPGVQDVIVSGPGVGARLLAYHLF